MAALAIPPLPSPKPQVLGNRLRLWGDPVLRETARPITKFDEVLRAQVESMKLLVAQKRGMGLAAPQLGIVNRVLVYDDQEDLKTKALINPRLTFVSSTWEAGLEGCLSLPRLRVEVVRALEIEGVAQSLEGEEYSFEASGLTARVIQHELDHLNGILILDRLSLEDQQQAVGQLLSSDWDSKPGEARHGK